MSSTDDHARTVLQHSERAVCEQIHDLLTKLDPDGVNALVDQAHAAVEAIEAAI